jgi:hypothetical protein
LDRIFDFLPHAVCLSFNPYLIAWMAFADLTIFMAYSAISTKLFAAWREGSFLLTFALTPQFGAFIGLCGLSHAVDLIVLYAPVYWADAFVTGATAVVSAWTAIDIWTKPKKTA